MKAIFFSALFCFSGVASAAQLRLQAGDLVTINPNVATTVTCEGDGNDGGTSCSDAIKGFNKLLKACATAYTPSYCIDKYWPDFKAKNESCATANIDVCLDACQTAYSASYCADKCSK